MTHDTEAFIKNCHDCQIHVNVPTLPPQDMISITSPWAFLQWGIDIVGPFPKAPGKLKLLIVAIGNFSKWVEVKVVTVITRERIIKFV